MFSIFRLFSKPNKLPAHGEKQQAIWEISQKKNCRILIETGTYKGQMVEAMRERFERIISIELDRDLYEQAKEKFKECRNVEIMQGDSGSLLPSILAGISQPCVFWLDGHYSAGITAKGELNTPIIKEVDAILGHSAAGHVILIDDARLFVGRDDYPSQEWLKKHILAVKPAAEFAVENDIIRIFL